MAAADRRYTDIEIQLLTRDSECGFCCLKLIEIEEPRVLPCGHIHCTQCLEGNINQSEIQCKVCEKKFSDITITLLPEVPRDTINEALVPVGERCNLSEGDPVKAIRCCADCNIKLCNAHSEEHERHVSHHEQLLLEDGLAPERYEVQRCDNNNHKNHVLNEICKHCMKLFCKRCDTRGLCSDAARTAAQQVHEVVPLREVTDELREKMRLLSQQLYDKMDRCRNLENKAQYDLGGLKDLVHRQCNTVDMIADEMITKIRCLRDDTKSELQAYVVEASSEVEKSSEENQITVAVLDDKFRYGQTIAHRTSDKRLLEEFSKAELQLTQAAGDMTLERALPLKRPYLSTDIPIVDMCTKVITEPTGLDFIRNKKTSGFCYGVSWSENGSRVLCAMRGGVEVRGDDGELIRKVDIADPRSTNSAHLMADRLYTKLTSFNTKKYLTYFGSLDDPLQTLLHEEEYEGRSRIYHISVSHNKLAIIEKGKKELRICTPDGTHMYNINLRDMIGPYGVELLPEDNSVIVTDYPGNQLKKYRLEPDAEPVWTCPGLMYASGVTTDESGLIYVTSDETGSIYLISPQGEKIEELNNPLLKETAEKGGWIHDISVSAGRIVLACRDEGVMYFNLL